MATLKKISVCTVACLVVIICSSVNRQSSIVNGKWATQKKGIVKICFINTVKNMPLVLDSIAYKNPFGEEYHIARLKYYISNIALHNASQQFAETNSYHLIDAADSNSLSFTIDATADTYNSISFIVGVDSLKNVSGAQSGALDPANGMFWTWNSGYVMFKLEGNSPASTIINHRIEYHIGGFSGADNVLQTITLPLQKKLNIEEGKNSEIIIMADLDKLWQGATDLKIATTPATMTPGTLSKKIAANYNRMFTIKEVLNK
ncbi:MbnP family protein [Ferruginibacter sp. SUN106]|uniref:MbnP family protein n=1 Tax=Ferruginibacter sp. SUN106 TaxID=2978348 RepID=UPI003D35EECA